MSREPSARPQMKFTRALGDFLHLEAAGGIVLALATVLAVLTANSGLFGLYQSFLDYPIDLSVGPLHLAEPVQLWINDALMAVFFLVVGAEIKRELVEGEMRSVRRAALPAIAALGGMAVPAAIYVLVNLGSPATLAGWAVPSATDIAFALGVLALLGRGVPASLKLFLLALAILDDLGAIVVIGLFYTAELSFVALGGAAALIAVMAALNMSGVRRLWPYLLLGAVLWLCVLKSGVHATLAGVATAFLIPLGKEKQGDIEGPLESLEHALHPWVNFGILPLFAFANAGLPLGGLNLDKLAAPVPLGILLGLFVGKQLGVMLFSWAAIRLRMVEMPAEASWLSLYGVSVLTGIGFTMSLFIGNLAFPGDAARIDEVRLGVLAGSLLAAIGGALVLMLARRRGVAAISASGSCGPAASSPPSER